ncbi:MULTISPECIES: 4'-phosphopantetheinyl transferase superfamily protein [unclassified Microcoleus]|uniref:4'-phosphopantetheinyl transferase superfamily protein n=1 Tax=unclassified Microcoleus TaxID=2642155 RepID=UPI002FD316AA
MQPASCWAAKDAVVKALGTRWRGIRYADVEVRRDDRGAPNVQLHGTAAARASATTETTEPLGRSPFVPRQKTTPSRDSPAKLKSKI